MSASEHRDPETMGLLQELDLRTEQWVVLRTMEDGYAPDRLLMRSMGRHGRSQRKEIARTSERNDTVEGGSLQCVHVRRQGIYDRLPEALFHEAGSARSERRNHVEDRHAERAREFFVPYEQEVHRLRAAMATLEWGMVTGSMRSRSIWNTYWDIPVDLDIRGQRALRKVLPLAAEVIGDLEATAACYTFVLGQQVRITLLEPSAQVLPGESREVVADMLLGNMVMGEVVHDGWPALLIEVLEVPVAKLSDEKQKRMMERSLAVLAHYLLPAHLEVRTEMLVKGADRGMDLGDASRPALLSANTYL